MLSNSILYTLLSAFEFEIRNQISMPIEAKEYLTSRVQEIKNDLDETKR